MTGMRHRKRKRLKRVLRRAGALGLFLAVIAGFVHYQTHDWFNRGPFTTQAVAAPDPSGKAADQMKLTRFGKLRYELSAWRDTDRTIFILRKPGGGIVWTQATQPGAGNLTFPYSREQMGWWGWRIPLSDGNAAGSLFISPLGNLRYYYFGAR